MDDYHKQWKPRVRGTRKSPSTNTNYASTRNGDAFSRRGEQFRAPTKTLTKSTRHAKTIRTFIIKTKRSKNKDETERTTRTARLADDNWPLATASRPIQLVRPAPTDDKAGLTGRKTNNEERMSNNRQQGVCLYYLAPNYTAPSGWLKAHFGHLYRRTDLPTTFQCARSVGRLPFPILKLKKKKRIDAHK